MPACVRVAPEVPGPILPRHSNPLTNPIDRGTGMNPNAVPAENGRRLFQDPLEWATASRSSEGRGGYSVSQQQPDYPSAADSEAMRLEFETNAQLEVEEDPERPPSRTGGGPPVAVGVLVGVFTGGPLVSLESCSCLRRRVW